jgi:hypothetical protein
MSMLLCRLTRHKRSPCREVLTNNSNPCAVTLFPSRPVLTPIRTQRRMVYRANRWATTLLPTHRQYTQCLESECHYLQYPCSQPVYPPSTYSMNDYQPLPTMYPPSSTTAAAYPSYGSPQEIAPPTNAVPLPSTSPGAQNNAVMPRILNSRPKPQCWEHGCNGRQFSTFSNLLRHQREKSGTASKSYCPRCGAEFTRTTARNGHMAHDKCKPRRASESSH